MEKENLKQQNGAILLRLTPDERKLLKTIAFQQGTTMTSLVKHLITHNTSLEELQFNYK